jgi:hypothetical protein
MVRCNTNDGRLAYFKKNYSTDISMHVEPGNTSIIGGKTHINKMGINLSLTINNKKDKRFVNWMINRPFAVASYLSLSLSMSWN